MITKDDILILDIETSSRYDINKEFDAYVLDAKVKWIGFYSYNKDKYYNIPVLGNEKLIKNVIGAHDVIVSFNGDEFDIPILKNNDLWPEKWINSIDLMIILGNKKMEGHKMRGELMGYKFKRNNLKVMAETMKLKTQKGDIDYNIFKKNVWLDKEIKDIKKYLETDIKITKQMFDKVFDFFYPFVNFLDERNQKNFTWIKSSIASVVYKSCCYLMGWDEEYGEHGKKDSMGGRVIEPKGEEYWDLWYVDVTSLYPHIYAMFNLIAEVQMFKNESWHGNDIFKVQGYYDVSNPHPLSLDLMKKLKLRLKLKKEDKKNPMVYALKIFLNTFYGTNRSPVFKNLHTPNSGYDCCWLGQQINQIMENLSKTMGYETIAGDTDSIFIKSKYKKSWDKVKKDLKNIVNFINSKVPFPQETFNIDIEHYIEYIMFVKSDLKTLKKNYCYIYNDNDKRDIVIMGLPIIKMTRTDLGALILEKYIKPRMMEESKGKFERIWMEKLIEKEIEGNIQLMVQEYRPSTFNTYSFAGKRCLTAQISKEYLNGKSGVVKLIKNRKIGKVGKAWKYCTIEEGKNLKVSDLDLTKVYNELNPFIKGEFSFDAKKLAQKNGFFNTNTSEGVLTLKSNGGFFK